MIEFGDNDLEADAQESQSNIAEIEQDARNLASVERVDEKYKLFQEDLADVASGRINRYGVEDKQQQAAAAQKSKTNDSFYMAAIAAAYNRPITLNIGGRQMPVRLGDIRDAASEGYNKASEQVRQLKSSGASAAKIKQEQDKADYYNRAMLLADAVARGEATPEQLKAHLESKKEYNKEFQTILKPEEVQEKEVEIANKGVGTLMGEEMKDTLSSLGGPEPISEGGNQNEIIKQPSLSLPGSGL